MNAPVAAPAVPATQAIASPRVSMLTRRLPALTALADQAVVSGTNFCATLLVGRAGGEGDLGLFALGFSLLLLVQSLQQSLVSVPLTVLGARTSGEARRRLAGSTLLHYVLIAALSAFGFLIAALVTWSANASSDFVPLLATLAATSPFFLLREYARRFEFAQLRVARALLLDALLAVLQISALFVSVGRFGAVPVVAHASLGITCAIAGMSWLVWNRSAFSISLQQAVADLRRHISFGSWVLSAALVSLANAYLMQWLLLFQLGTAATGMYAACMTLIDLSNPLLLGIGNLVGPQAAHARAHEGPAGLRRIIGRATLLLGVTMALFASVLSLGGGRLVLMLFGREYSADPRLVTVLAWAAFCSAVGAAAAEGLSALERPRFNLWAGLAGLTSTVSVAWVLLPSLGLWGAGVALVCGNSTAMLIRNVLFWRSVARGAVQ